jgi:xanthine dehydrogenase YagS FAD-binding subunit
MRPFSFERTHTVSAAIEASDRARAQASAFLAGGTTLLDLMKLDVMRPGVVIDINALADSSLGVIEQSSEGLRLGAPLFACQTPPRILTCDATTL